MRRFVLLVATLLVAAVPAAHAARLPLPLDPCRAAVAPADGPAGLHEWVGALHEHSAYSDGFPDSIPADYYRSGKCFGLDFLVGSEHSDNLDLPMALNEECLPPASPAPCAIADKDNPANSFRKWDATQEQADAEQTSDFTTDRAFEWSSDRFGHINVYFSQYEVNAKDDGGYADLDAFYRWAERSPELHGGGDGLLTFNHPGDKSLCGQLQHVCADNADPGFNWNDFAYDPKLDDRMVGLETFNGTKDFGPYYARALDKGWHVGAVGAEDKGHKRTDHWGSDDLAKTVFIAPGNTRATLREAMHERRMYATLGRGLRLDFTIDGAVMGSRLEREPLAPLHVHGALRGWDGAPLDGRVDLDLVTNSGDVIASATDTDLDMDVAFQRVPAGATADRWYYLRASRAGHTVAYSSPIWVQPNDRPGQWLAGDLHVHTCYSHDVFCGPLDQPLQIEPGDNPADLAAEEAQYDTSPDNLQQLYAYGMPVGARFEEASLRGLDYLAITDHNDVRSVTSRGFGAEGVVGIPGYENSIRGHAQVLGERRLLDNGDQSAAAINALEDQVHADGGILQANHPGYTISSPFSSCANTGGLHWKYGYAVQPDTIEVWNPTSPVLDAETYLECWLNRGAHIGVTGGSDSHWTSITAVQGVGNPTTWVFAKGRSRRDVLAALRAGRTSVTRFPPSEGGAPLLLEAKGADGTWSTAVGDTVAPGTPMRVRSQSPATTGLVTVRANGTAVVADQPLAPGGEVDFTAPDHGWMRAILHTVGSAGESAPDCHHELGQSEPASDCAYDHSLLGLTSPAYVG